MQFQPSFAMVSYRPAASGYNFGCSAAPGQNDAPFPLFRLDSLP